MIFCPIFLTIKQPNKFWATLIAERLKKRWLSILFFWLPASPVKYARPVKYALRLEEISLSKHLTGQALLNKLRFTQGFNGASRGNDDYIYVPVIIFIKSATL